MASTYDLIVIGTGVAATGIAQQCRSVGWRVAIVDRRPFGGTCMLRGCDPKKLLWGVAEVVDEARRFQGDGFEAQNISLRWSDLARFKRSFFENAPSAVEQRLKGAGIETFHGSARFVDHNSVAIDGETLIGRHIVIASGSRPAPLPISGAENLLTSDDFLDLEELPERLIFVGGGYISFEFAHIAARAGAKTTILHADDKPLAHFDRALVERLLDKSRRLGIDVRLNCRVERIEKTGEGIEVSTKDASFEADVAVHGAGRVPDIDDLDLEAGGIERDGPRLRLNQWLQSVSNPAVYAAGDAANAGPMLTPVSELDAEVVAANLLDGARRSPQYAGVPSVVFTIPPLASVGQNEASGDAPIKVTEGDISSWYSARRVKEDTAAYKLLTDPNTRRLLGAHIIGPNAEEEINIFALAMRLGLRLDQLREFVPAYPSEAADIPYMLG
ncbi:NAD(P)/FAD-dependent oxidoreductase [Methylocystis sp. MJC1]|jgi:glutathione reductase (NADPH)|uniref:dihydrolipoyl dehydrogenase family protein n=1 Tax=Methylocystis sp. MJC1 TaxID=2654282 RepID=UPI0013ED0192|nr:NAD(P)/FAD-dependent oxidoreductase [Methylocystis sp. MJC1]KAF2990042.1 Glutathione amide reductase [Methylocystis sp. MJC1]MBU6528758.1 NAD(P)/FAD-dependent oxidoreductase [Methylocystis sp. MJC1]UZX11644.1 NAD(P)/FAD-dependent oxidoreductase [Methylocystis sp. MJC1]